MPQSPESSAFAHAMEQIEKCADLPGPVEPCAKKERRRGRHGTQRMLFAKAVGVALPDRVVVASRRVYDTQVRGDAQPETLPRSPQAPVKVAQVKAVERPGIE